MIWYAAPTPPEGFIECNGQSTAAYPALAIIVGATVPDLRGEFIRGWAHDRTGIPDAGRSFGNWQIDELKSHKHDAGYALPYGADGNYNGTPYIGHGVGPIFGTTSTYFAGGTESRPRNISLLPCIKI